LPRRAEYGKRIGDYTVRFALHDGEDLSLR
jgi:hypothetical protein